MNIYQKVAIATASLVFSLGIREAKLVQAATFSFFLEPNDFLNLTGTFEASDLDSNSRLTRNEVTNFEVNFPGNAFLSPLSYGLDNLVILNLDLNNFNNFEFLATSSDFIRNFAASNNFFEPNNGFTLNQLAANDPNATAIASSNQYNPFVGNVGTTVYDQGLGAGTSSLPTVVPEPSTVSVSALSFCILGVGLLKKKLRAR